MRREQVYLSTIDPSAGDVARELGLGIEIASFCTAMNMDDLLQQTEESLAPMLEGVARRTFHGPFNELFPCAIDPKARTLALERYLQGMALARQYGADKYILHGGFHPYIYYPVWYVEQSIAFWQAFVPQIPEGMTVCLENVLEPEPEMLLQIVEAVNSPRLRLCLDIGHANAYSSVSVFRWLEQWGNRISHFHIHNNDGTADAHQPLGEGTIPMAELLRKAEALCPEATYTLELPDCRDSARGLDMV